MELIKGMKIKQTKSNKDEMFKNTCANSVLVFEVEKVNRKTYGLKCIEGYMKNVRCTLSKSFKISSVDVYGTVTKWEVIA